MIKKNIQDFDIFRSFILSIVIDTNYFCINNRAN